MRPPPLKLRRTRRSAERVGGDIFYSRKDLILNQYHRRVQKTWLRTGSGHGHETAFTVHQPHPFGRSRGSLDLLAVRDTVPAFRRDDDGGQGGQQTFHRDDGDGWDAAAELFQGRG